jgi:hypothetical protein
MITCKGNGECLQQNEYTHEYYKTNNTICEHNCIALHCPNYIVCGSMAPKYILDMQNDLCYYCNDMFVTEKGGNGKLRAIDNVDCPICWDKTRCVTQPRCDHYTCVDCFRRCYYGEDDSENEPEFPYSEIYKYAYYNDYNNPLWKEDESVKKWLIDWNNWNDVRIAKRESEGYLQMCPVCRK